MQFAVIFDVDGVLVDSYDAHFESWKQVASEHGIPFGRRTFDASFGRTSRAIIRDLWPAEARDDPAVIRAIDDRKETLYRDLVAAEFPAMDGAVELIDSLREAGFRIAAGSSGPPENVELCLQRLERRDSFDAVITGVDVTRSKPDPQVFLLAAERLGIAPAYCVVVEDAPAGIKAAKSAGMACIGFASTGRTREELSDADLVVDSLRELSPVNFLDLLKRTIGSRPS